MRKGKENFIMGAISIISNEFNNYGGQFIKDITFKQWFLLMMISKMEGDSHTVNAIADFAGSTRQNVRKLLAQLEDKKFVKVDADKNDLRAYSVSLTDKAYKYFYENDDKISVGVSRLFSSMPDAEVDGLVSGLKKLMGVLEEQLNKHHK